MNEPFAKKPLLFLKINPQSKIGLSQGRVGHTQREVGVLRPLSCAPVPTVGRGTGADHSRAARHVRGSGRKKVEIKMKNRQTKQEIEKLLIQRTHHIFKATKIGEIDTYQHCIFQIFKSTQNRQIGALDLGVGGKLTKQCKVGTQPIYNEADSDGVDDNQQVDSE
jgi:hypothetical protein